MHGMQLKQPEDAHIIREDPMLAEAIQLLTENYRAFKERRKFGEVGVVIKFEDGTPVRGEEICNGTFKRKPKA